MSTYFASKIARGFLSSDILNVDSMPGDAVEISPLQHAAFMAAQAAGLELDWSGPGPLPEVVDRRQSPERIQATLTAVIQAHVDALPRAWGYDNAASCVTYADEPAVPQFQAEGQTVRAWRSQCWAAGAQVLTEVLAGQRQVPSDAELLALMPAAPARPVAP